MRDTITSRRHPATILTSASIAFAGLLAARAAPAAPEAQIAKRATHDVRCNFGFASAVGLIGLTYSVSPAPALELEGGVGWGWSGMQLSLMPKLSLGNAQHRFVAGVGASASIDPQGPRPEAYVAGWLNAELGYSLRASAHWSLLVAAGVTTGLAGEMHPVCFFDCYEEPDRRGTPVKDFITPTVRVAGGFWF